jgi:hypothetical protein
LLVSVLRCYFCFLNNLALDKNTAQSITASKGKTASVVNSGMSVGVGEFSGVEVVVAG